MRKICKLILKLLYFKVDLENIPKEKKYVLIVAPHTSWTDFVIGKIALTAMNVKTTFLMKKEIFIFPLGVFLRYIGGYPVDRQHTKNLTDTFAEYIKNSNEIAFLIAPEGTRRKVDIWKRGFYYIALKSQVPIALGYLDYRNRKGGIGTVFYPTGDYNADLQEIQKFYYGMRGRRKGCFNLEEKEI